MNSETLQEFNEILSLVDCDTATELQDANVAYNRFLGSFSRPYDLTFLKQGIKIKNKTVRKQ